MSQAIVTKYLGPTNYRGARVVAKAQAGRVVVDWDDGMGILDNHRAAALKLIDMLEWWGRLEGGGLPDGTGFAFVLFTPDVSK